MEELAKEQKNPSPVTKERLRKALPWIILANVLVWGGFGVAAAIMFVSMGAWPWVVWPFAAYWWGHHIQRKVAVYHKAKEPKVLTPSLSINVAEMSDEQIAEAAARAVRDLKFSR